MSRRQLSFVCEGAELWGTLDAAPGRTGLLIVSGGNEIRSGPWGSTPEAPPPADAPAWHVAVGGEANGPFDASALGGMAAKGLLTKASWVWTPGSDGWKRAGDIAGLASMFGSLPPKPPAD